MNAHAKDVHPALAFGAFTLVGVGIAAMADLPVDPGFVILVIIVVLHGMLYDRVWASVRDSQGKYALRPSARDLTLLWLTLAHFVCSLVCIVGLQAGATVLFVSAGVIMILAGTIGGLLAILLPRRHRGSNPQ